MNNRNIVSLMNLMKICAISGFMFYVASCNKESKTGEANNNNTTEEAEKFTIVEELPAPDGGMSSFYKYLQSNVAYPLLARQNGIEGRVTIEFVVERDGSLSKIKAVKGISQECDNEAVKMVKNAPAFKAGRQRGRAVRVRMRIPFDFKLIPTITNKDNSPQGIIIVEKAEIVKDMLKVDASFASGVWSGTIYSADGEPLPGTNIVLKGTTFGTVSDLDGTFSLDAQESQQLVISFVGYETEIVKTN